MAENTSEVEALEPDTPETIDVMSIEDDDVFMAEMRLALSGEARSTVEPADIKESQDTISVEEKTEEAVDSDQEDTSTNNDNNVADENEVEIHENQQDEPAKEFSEAEKFYNDITGSKIKVNGVDMDPITDPREILKMQEEFYSLKNSEAERSDMDSISRALRENGLLEGDSLGLLIEAKKGNVDAIRLLLKSNDIDPLSLVHQDDDSEEKSVDTSKHYETKEDRDFYSFVDEADKNGTIDGIKNNIIEKWDAESIEAMISNKAIKSNILEHAKNGVMKQVMEEMVRQEVHFPGFDKMNSLQKYIHSNNVIADRIAAETPQPNFVDRSEPVPQVKVETTAPVIDQEEEDRLNNAKRLATATADVSAEETVTQEKEQTDSDFMNEFRAMFNQ